MRYEMLSIPRVRERIYIVCVRGGVWVNVCAALHQLYFVCPALSTEYGIDITIPTPPLCVYLMRPHKMLYLVNWTQMDTTSNIMSFCGAWLIRRSSTSTYKTNSLAINIMEIMSNQPNGLSFYILWPPRFFFLLNGGVNYNI